LTPAQIRDFRNQLHQAKVSCNFLQCIIQFALTVLTRYFLYLQRTLSLRGIISKHAFYISDDIFFSLQSFLERSSHPRGIMITRANFVNSSPSHPLAFLMSLYSLPFAGEGNRSAQTGSRYILKRNV